MFKRKKLNDNGSTLVMAVVAIAFAALLVATILVASMANINLKRMANRSKNTFYTAESVLDEIRAGVGHDSISSMSMSYEKVLTTLVREGTSYSYVINNEQANEEFKDKFIEDMLKKVTNDQLSFGTEAMVVSVDPVILNHTIEYLDNFIQGYDGIEKTAKVKSISKITAIKESDVTALRYTIILKDVVIDYKEEKADEDYFSNVTVDLDITFPNLTIDFTGGNKIASFIEYCLATDSNISIMGHELNVNGAHIYAGQDIRVTADGNVDKGGKLVVVGNVISPEGGVSNANIITRGNIVVRGSDYFKSEFTVNGGDIWCNNLVADSYITGSGTNARDKSLGADINIDALSQTYIKDDLNIFGQNSSVKVGGNMYAYSYDGSSNVNHATSSAIIVSGSGSALSINVQKLIIGGRSYVIIPGETQNYMTGESLSVKADQELYLVPSNYIYSNPGNPMADTAWTTVQTNQADPTENIEGTPLVNVTSSFAYNADQSLSLLNNAEPYITKSSGNVTYVYYNFKDKASATEYVKRILEGADAGLKSNINTYFSSVVDGITISAGNMYTAGVLMRSSGGGISNSGSSQTGTMDAVTYADSAGIITTDVFTLASMNYKNRYEILTHLLVDIPETKLGTEYIVNDTDAALAEFYSNYVPTATDMINDATSNIVDYSLVESTPYNSEGNLIMYDSGIIKMAIDEATYVVPDEVKGGIIINTGSVKLDHDFKGLIICKGNIIISNDATITTDATMVETLIKNEYLFNDGASGDDDRQVEEKPFKNYFYAYKMSAGEDDTSEPVKIENISYTDIVGANNWRKYDGGN